MPDKVFGVKNAGIPVLIIECLMSLENTGPIPLPHLRHCRLRRVLHSPPHILRSLR